MPQFYPAHTPDDCDAFTRGYLSAAEWLANAAVDRPDSSLTDAERDRCRGFTREAIACARRDCAKFQQENADDLAAFSEATGRDMELAGYCFWLNRNRHGAGFWDRDAGEVGERLSEASMKYAEIDCVMYRNRLSFE